ncbi:MAG: SNF2-related protein [Thermoleophilia bacterium]
MRDGIVRQQLESIPLAKLKETTEGRVRLGVIESAGFKTVASVLDAGESRLARIHGVGEQSIWQVIAAGRQLEKALETNVRVRFDPDKKPKEQAVLLKALAGYDTAEAVIGPLEKDLQSLVGRIEGLSQRADRTTSKLKMFFSGARKRDDARSALIELDTLLRAPQTRILEKRLGEAKLELARAGKKSDTSVWADFEERVARFNGLLIDIGGQTADTEAGQGYLSAEIAQAVHNHPLDVSLLNVSLRGYQAFGAKFALAQKKAILGDEMGLGKTVEALASICHLAMSGKKHFLVVSPASVLVNWLHETQRHTQLEAFRLYGPDRDVNLKLWARKGGVAATTFEALKTMDKPDEAKVAMLVVDEAHYVKNPDAQRTQAVKKWIGHAERTLFPTGTPMENRIQEFKTLVHHLQPKVAARVDAMDALIGAARFRSTVAPVYLRRNQDDVLQEPPTESTPRSGSSSTEPISPRTERRASGNFMAMRSSCLCARKALRFREARAPAGDRRRVGRGESQDRRLLVLPRRADTIAKAPGDMALQPLTGSVLLHSGRSSWTTSRSERLRRAREPIEAGGVGLNIQAASVVILAEPQ